MKTSFLKSASEACKILILYCLIYQNDGNKRQQIQTERYLK
jgi:hypothetical protein